MGCQWKVYLYTCFSSLCSTTEWIAIKFRTHIHVPLRRTFTNSNMNYLLFYHFLLPNLMKWACRRTLQPWPKVTAKTDLSIMTNNRDTEAMLPRRQVTKLFSPWTTCTKCQVDADLSRARRDRRNTGNWERERGKHYGCMLLLCAR